MRGMNAVSGIKRLSGNPLRYLTLGCGCSYKKLELATGGAMEGSVGIFGTGGQLVPALALIYLP